MSLDPGRVVRGTTPATSTPDGLPPSELRKSDLVGHLVAFTVTGYDEAALTQYGAQAQVDVDLLVVDGPSAGARDPRWRTFGNLARQMGAQPAGATVVARVTSGPGRAPGSTWYGINLDVSDADVELARAAVTAATVAGTEPRRQSPTAPPPTLQTVEAPASSHHDSPPF